MSTGMRMAATCSRARQCARHERVAAVPSKATIWRVLTGADAAEVDAAGWPSGQESLSVLMRRWAPRHWAAPAKTTRRGRC